MENKGKKDITNFEKCLREESKFGFDQFENVTQTAVIHFSY